MTRLLQSCRLFLVLLGLAVTWPINPILALMRVKTPIRRWLLRNLPGGDIYFPML